MLMTVYGAENNDSQIERDVIDRECGAGEVACPECGGSGDWSRYYPGPEPYPCTDCKGTGRLLVSI